jgi:hypothetical protein
LVIFLILFCGYLLLKSAISAIIAAIAATIAPKGLGILAIV